MRSGVDVFIKTKLKNSFEFWNIVDLVGLFVFAWLIDLFLVQYAHCSWYIINIKLMFAAVCMCDIFRETHKASKSSLDWIEFKILVWFGKVSDH